MSLVLALLLSAAADASQLDRIEVVGRRPDGLGRDFSASEGRVEGDEIQARPLLRTGDVLEFVPGLVATQHSGSGKANQFFLRGFNLDHGTDFATFVDGMPVNLRSHGHGQGYTDLGFLIPELVDSLRYRKGPYAAEVGDFSSAGSAELSLLRRATGTRVQLAAGEYGYRRALLLDGAEIAGLDSVFGFEAQTHDGPWRALDEDVAKRNAVWRVVEGEPGAGSSLSLMHYRNRWNSADQIPLRAVESGRIDRFGSIDPSLGGRSERSSLSGRHERPLLGGQLHASAYLIDYEFELFSNFTYFLESPQDGDQFQQFDERRVSGGSLQQYWLLGRHRLQAGVDLRRDDIAAVGLRRSQDRQPLDAIRTDAVDQRSTGVHLLLESALGPRLRSQLALRHDWHRFEVRADRLDNGGRQRASTSAPKASLAWRASEAIEWYASHGRGLHSNDARGTTLRVDPLTGAPAEPADPLVRSRGSELGLRYQPGRDWSLAAAAWQLDLDSELLFVGDAGGTEASGASRRHGFELGLYWSGGRQWSGDLELGWTDSRFREADPAGREIPGALPFVASLALRWEGPARWYAQARLRHFDGYPLIEDGRVQAASSQLAHLRIGKRWQQVELGLEVLNLFDSDDFDIEYLYASRLPGEAIEGVVDRHAHPFEPRSLRLSLEYRFD